MSPRTPLIHLVEDDFIIAENIRESLSEMGYPTVVVSHTYDDAIRDFVRNMPDLLILDIQLDRSDCDGTDLARELSAIKPVQIVFLSAHIDDTYQRKAFATGPSNYLVKPVSKDQLRVAISGALHQWEAYLAPMAVADTEAHHHFFVKSQGLYVRITPENLIYAQADGSYCHICTTDGRHTLSINLRAFLEKCRGFHHFVKCHRSYAVNRNYIRAYDAKLLYLEGTDQQESIPYSHEYKAWL